MDFQYLPVFPGKTHIGDDGNASANIDGIWLSPLFQESLKSKKSFIVLNEKIEGKYLSDHFGVMGIFEKNY